MSCASLRKTLRNSPLHIIVSRLIQVLHHFHEATLRVLRIEIRTSWPLLFRFFSGARTGLFSQVDPNFLFFLLERDRHTIRLDLNAARSWVDMIGQWFQQKAPILALESPDLKIYCICFELALNGLLIVSSDALEPFQEVHLDQTWFVLVPSVVFNLRELHVTEIYRLAAWTQDLGLLLFFCSRSLSLLLYQGRGFGLLQQAIDAANLT